MKLSKYNINVKDNDINILYNTLTRKYISYPPEKETLISNLIMNLNKSEYSLHEGNILKTLIEKGIIIQDEFNELEQVKFLVNKSTFQEECFYLVIQPTLDCNFRCTYCYEEHKKVEFKVQTIDAILELVEKITRRISKLILCWFGGEPMLEFNKICELTSKFKDICLCNGCKYEAKMTTNGYLFSDYSINMLEELCIKKIQITLDGYESYHDKKRPLANGMGTFKKIKENLLKILDKNVLVVLRLNVDEENYYGVESLLEVIPIDKRKMIILNMINLFQNNGKVSLNNLYKMAIDKGFIYYDTVNNYSKCEGTMKNSITIQPDGKLTCCSIAAENNFYFGKITNEGELNVNKAIYYAFQNISPIDNQNCTECIKLPMCLGGCKYGRYRKSDKNPCNRSDGMSLDEVVKMHFYSDLKNDKLVESNII